MRDLEADLELCEKATPGPWGVCRVIHNDGDHLIQLFSDPADQYGHSSFGATNHDAAFIAAAREGWPEAIRRAMEAEARMGRMIGILEDGCQKCRRSCGLDIGMGRCEDDCLIGKTLDTLRKERGEE